jgi:hypothetical protein
MNAALDPFHLFEKFSEMAWAPSCIGRDDRSAEPIVPFPVLSP